MPIADPRIALPVGERQYHIGLGPGQLAEYILLPGDPDSVLGGPMCVGGGGGGGGGGGAYSKAPTSTAVPTWRGKENRPGADPRWSVDRL